MMKFLAAGFLSFGLVLSLPLCAAGAKKSTAPKASSKSSKTSKKSATKSKKSAATRAAQQHPTTERYIEIQKALVERGYLQDASGNWGADSVEALKKFQKDQRLPSDGKLGALSLRALGLGPRRGDTIEDAITAGVLPSAPGPTPLD
jgi:murein L,D-transpeptidase YcbB/YkuD